MMMIVIALPQNGGDGTFDVAAICGGVRPITPIYMVIIDGRDGRWDDGHGSLKWFIALTRIQADIRVVA